MEPKNKSTPPYLNDFERAKLIADRAEALSKGAKLLLTKKEQGSECNFARLALYEFELKKLPLVLLRTAANGTLEVWNLSDLRATSDTTPHQVSFSAQRK